MSIAGRMMINGVEWSWSNNAYRRHGVITAWVEPDGERDWVLWDAQSYMRGTPIMRGEGPFELATAFENVPHGG
jgi:hypothetical protein